LPGRSDGTPRFVFRESAASRGILLSSLLSRNSYELSSISPLLSDVACHRAVSECGFPVSSLYPSYSADFLQLFSWISPFQSFLFSSPWSLMRMFGSYPMRRLSLLFWVGRVSSGRSFPIEPGRLIYNRRCAMDLWCGSILSFPFTHFFGFFPSPTQDKFNTYRREASQLSSGPFPPNLHTDLT